MITTEQEAYDRWCPFARVAIEMKLPSAFNRIISVDGGRGNVARGSNCIGSACMAWRWNYPSPPTPRWRWCYSEWDSLDEAERAEKRHTEPARPEEIPASWIFTPSAADEKGPGGAPMWVEPEAEAALRRTGVCGLAGKAAGM